MIGQFMVLKMDYDTVTSKKSHMTQIDTFWKILELKKLV